MSPEEMKLAVKVRASLMRNLCRRAEEAVSSGEDSRPWHKDMLANQISEAATALICALYGLDKLEALEKTT